MINADLIKLLLPVVLLEIILMVLALRDLVRRECVTGGNKVLWGIIIVIFQVIGPIIYFVFGRKDTCTQ